MWQFIVAPHRGAMSTGLWSVRLDGQLVGIHASYLEAVHDAVHRAARHWADTGTDSQIMVAHAAESLGELVQWRARRERAATS